MPVFGYTPRTVNDKSTLTPGYHPAFLLAIKDEPIPDGWEMKKHGPNMWRWLFAVWQSPQAIAAGERPEHQSATSSQTFSPGGKFQPSKAYVWTCALLGRKIAEGELIDIDPMLPLPCMVMVSRNKQDGTPIEYANLKELMTWPEGMQLLTPEFRQKLKVFLETPVENTPPQQPAQPAYQAPQGGHTPQHPPVGYPSQPPASQPPYQAPQPQQPTLPGTPAPTSRF